MVTGAVGIVDEVAADIIWRRPAHRQLGCPFRTALSYGVHDGMGNDHELLASECQRLRDKKLIPGVGIGMGEMETGLLKEQFGPDRYIHCATPEELPTKMGAILRAVRGV